MGLSFGALVVRRSLLLGELLHLSSQQTGAAKVLAGTDAFDRQQRTPVAHRETVPGDVDQGVAVIGWPDPVLRHAHLADAPCSGHPLSTVGMHGAFR
jgi:hypothetical protein